ncbi:hypothetical protein ACIF70_22990 [Actinacidiphila glaucinigra]|uniref:hypothetical protein n=1 Tax=Actinacidiphila glaucinigra TaxID=235986 RepID=UPI002DDAFA79|nr:hypothetical protein [Actinacidiphila glaucinigra]WSD58800.1 hypothetical protein OIE69_07690 [Actinacidiphila glaucinigra]
MPVSATDDDALFVLTAAMLTPAQFPSVLADDYPAACAELGLDPVDDGYGLVFGQDGTGARWTVAISDTALVACALAAWDCGLEYDLSPDERSVVAALPGWPLPVAVAAPGVPDPHDPPETEGGPPLSPPDTATWGPAQRRLGADEIALRWRIWREQLVAGDESEASDEAGGSGSVDPPPATGAPDEAAQESTAPESTALESADQETAGKKSAEQREEPSREEPGANGIHPGVRRALEAAQEYLRTPPPPGRIRSTAAGEGVRTLRVDGEDWSLVARTDDIAFVLLDEEPGEVLPVGRGPELPGLLEALEKLAVRPA